MKVLHLLGGIVIGGLAALILLRMPWPGASLPPPAWILVVAMLPLLFWAIVGIHETGHLIGGAIGRFEPCLLIVGPIKVERTRAGWRIGVNRVFPLAGGLAAATPIGIDRLRRRMTLLIAGGPGASLITGYAALALPRMFGVTGDTRLSGAAAFAFVLLVAFALGSIAVGAAALVPTHGHGFSSDGARILRFLRSGPEVDGEVALLALVGVSMGGRRPRDWDPGLVSLVLQLDLSTPQGVAARTLAFSHALDRGEIARAREYLRAALAGRHVLPRMSQPSLLLQAAYFEARHEGDVVSARRRLFEAREGVLVAPYARPLAEAAVLVAEGDPAADDVLATAARVVSRSIDRGGAIMAADLIAELSLPRSSPGDRVRS